MHRKRRAYHSGNHLLYRGVLLLCFCAVISFFLVRMIPQNAVSSSFLLSRITQTVLSFHTPTETDFRISPYDLLENSILSIKASEIMQKKYAAKSGGFVKREIPKKTDEKAQDIVVDNIVESDMSVQGIKFINTPQVAVSAEELLRSPLYFYPQDGAPRVLIVHTHTSEAYAESPNSRSEDKNQNVVAVGAEIKKALKKAGIGVIHDTTQNDNPSYNKSYTKALSVIERNLAAYPTLEVVLDIHRDYIKRDDDTLAKPTIKLQNGQKAAQVMFVMGTDAMGLYHPEWRHNLAFSAQIQNRLQQTVPGLCRAINIRTERFNQHATKGSMIIEVGTGVNTIEEAKLSGKLLGEAIAYVLTQIK